MAIREDELAARHMGINTTVAKLSAFALGASFSGLAGVAYASKLQLVSPDQFQFSVSVLVLSSLAILVVNRETLANGSLWRTALFTGSCARAG